MGIEDRNGKNVDLTQENTGENLQTQKEITEILDEEQTLLKMIGEIKDEDVKKVVLSYNSDKIYPSKRIEKELRIYNDLVGKLSSEKLAELNGFILRGMLPSDGLNELEIKAAILAEEDSEVKKLMEISLESGVIPSVIMEGKDKYSKLAVVEDSTEKDLILRYLSEGYTPKSVFDEYEIFGEIMSYPYKDENLKNFLLSLIKDEDVLPSLIGLNFDLLKDEKFGEKTENDIRGLLNQPKKKLIVI